MSPVGNPVVTPYKPKTTPPMSILERPPTASAPGIGWFGPRILDVMESGQLEIPRFSKAQHRYPVYRIPLYPLLVIPQM